MMKYVLTLSLLLALAGCGVAPTKIEPTVPIASAKMSVDIDPALLTECPEHLSPVPAADTVVTEKDSLTFVSAWDAENYGCALRHNQLVDIVKKAFNITDPQPASQPIPNQ